MTELRISVAEHIDAVEAAAWDACANPHASIISGKVDAGNGQERPTPNAAPGPEQDTYNPFISHAFLAALEQSNSVGERTGWVDDKQGILGTCWRAAPTADWLRPLPAT